MKNAFRLIPAAFAASLALVSCDKENIIDNGTNNENGARVIAVDFAKTKSTLGTDGFTPSFAAGDMIKVSNGSAAEECIVSVNGGIATITTTLSGALDAVYPASAAKMNDNAIDGIVVPSTQDGTFASANICKAAIADGATTATFQNQTAVFRFYVDASIGVKSITMVSTYDIATGSKTIMITHDGTTTLDNFTDGPDKRLCYAAILGGVDAGTITFSSATTTQGTVTRPKPMANVTLAAGTMYNAFIPYYVQVKVGSNIDAYQKWGYCNVGAFLPEEGGDYFQWGATTGHKINSAKNAIADGFSFNWANAPFNNGSTTFDSNYYDSVKATECPDGVLAMKNDAARANWGGEWRMPTLDDLELLISVGTSKALDSTNGYLFGIAPNQILLPKVGTFSGSTLYSYGESVNYWTSSSSSASGLSYNLLLNANIINGSSSRNFGEQIRPIID